MRIFSTKLLWGTLILVLLVLLYALIESWTGPVPAGVYSTRPGPAVCRPLPERGPDDQVSLRVVPVADRPAVACARVYNGRPDQIYYGWSSLRLERRWCGLVWSSVLRLKELLPEREEVLVKWALRYVEGKGFADFLLPSPYDPAPAGTYRVRFRYRPDGQEAEQTVYSEEFTLP